MFTAAMIHLLLVLLGCGIIIGAVRLKSFISGLLILGKVPSDVPPGSMGWPVVGETLAFLHPHNSNSIGKFLQERCSRYGRVFKSHLFGNPTVVSCDLELNTFILQNEGRLFSSSYPRPIRNILGQQAILLASGQVHKRLRNAAVSFVNTSKLSRDFLSYIEKSSIAMMESWKVDHTQQVPFSMEAKVLTFNLTLKNVLDMDRLDEQASNILEDFITFTKGFFALPIYLPGNAYANAMKAKTRIWSTLREIMRERQKKRERQVTAPVSPGCWTGESMDVLEEVFLKGHLNDEEKVGVVLDLLLGGYKTTSVLMGLVVYFLARSPCALQQMKEEHEFLRRNKKDGEPLTLDDYKRMVFTSKVINETLRCGNVVKSVYRKALKDVKYKNFLIPSGWQVLPIFSATHLDPSFHENPSVFDPWRWDDEATSKKMTPFGGGLRLCPGAELAKLETAFFLHHLVIRFRWKIRDDECPISYPSVEFKRGLLLEMEPAAGG